MSKLRAINSLYTDDARAVLEGALEQGFESVIVLGYKNSQVWTKCSASKSRQAILGAMEIAKWELLQN